MKQISKRAFDRNEDHAAITFAYRNDDAYYPGKMANTGEDGMNFETDVELRPGADIVIKVANGREKKPGAVVDHVYRARVVWRRKADDVFKVGVRYLENVCHNCGEKIHYLDIETKDHAILCGSCHALLEGMGPGKLRECVENYIMGNVI